MCKNSVKAEPQTPSAKVDSPKQPEALHDLARFHSNFEGGHLGVVRGLPPTTREDLRFDGYLEYPHATNAIHVFSGIRTQSLRHRSQHR
ncbi:hypothetical protein TNCV_2411231 [Trichonephila clavipes]|nr:hypothetical protein TNCV_2411231 [Trichonephila clavipes]